jgi:hypothetical protein
MQTEPKVHLLKKLHPNEVCGQKEYMIIFILALIIAIIALSICLLSPFVIPKGIANNGVVSLHFALIRILCKSARHMCQKDQHDTNSYVSMSPSQITSSLLCFVNNSNLG